jgi:nitrogen regulatory protein PII
VREFRIELHCDDDCVDELVGAIVAAGRTGQQLAGWVYVSDVTAAHPIR